MTVTSQSDPKPARSTLDDLLQPDVALDIVMQHARPRLTESLPLADAPWRVLAEAVIASEHHPPFAAATMDGYAVIADDASPWREVIGDQAAGFVLDAEVTPGTAIRITTGAPVPSGADAVVRVEETEPSEDHVIIHQHEIEPGENIRPIGADLRQGDAVLAAGMVLGPAEIGLLAGIGIDQISVYRRVRASVLSTGNELVEPGTPVGPGQIRDSNRFSLVTALQRAGCDIVWSGKAPDERDALRAMLVERITGSDLVLTSGGVSMGHLDLVKPLLDELATVHFRRLFMKPGKPLNFATADDTLIFGLPGNPVSALVGFEVLIQPAIRAMSGQTRLHHARLPVTLATATTPSDRIEFQRARVGIDHDGRLVATPNGPQASSRLASFIGANALLIVPPRGTAYAAGERLEAIILGPIEGRPPDV